MSIECFTVERNVGRLVEARVLALATRADVERYAQSFKPFAKDTAGLVLCADHRAVRIYAPEVADDLISLFTKLNTVWRRAVLIAAPSNATLTIQLQRVVRSSNSSARRLVVDTAAAETFVADMLDAAEKARLVEFLRQEPGATSAGRPSEQPPSEGRRFGSNSGRP
jgi:hypothetical protein